VISFQQSATIPDQQAPVAMHEKPVKRQRLKFALVMEYAKEPEILSS
jgi:hypothetical protein